MPNNLNNWHKQRFSKINPIVAKYNLSIAKGVELVEWSKSVPIIYIVFVFAINETFEKFG
jgi:hypothetical protein